MITLFNYVRPFLFTNPAKSCRRSQQGQATAEYALVLLGAAAVALLVGAWAGKTGLIAKLFDMAIDFVISKITG